MKKCKRCGKLIEDEGCECSAPEDEELEEENE